LTCRSGSETICPGRSRGRRDRPLRSTRAGTDTPNRAATLTRSSPLRTRYVRPPWVAGTEAEAVPAVKPGSVEISRGRAWGGAAAALRAWAGERKGVVAE